MRTLRHLIQSLLGLLFMFVPPGEPRTTSAVQDTTPIANSVSWDPAPVPPGRSAPGDPTLIVTPGRVEFVDASRGAPRDVLKFALAEAVRLARPGDVIGIRGDLSHSPPIQMGGGIVGLKAFRADWGEEPIRELTLIGLGKGRVDAIGSIEFWGPTLGGAAFGGVESIRLENLTLRASKYARQPLFVPKGHTVGTIQVYDCTFAGAHAGGYGGFGQKWGLRSAGRGTFDIRDTHCEGVQEHMLYLDSPQDDNYFIGLTMERSWRTMIQVVNRSFDNPGRPSMGDLLIQDCHARGIGGDGGSAFTIAGHLGRVFLRDCSVKESQHGAVVVWTEGKQQHGAALHRAEDGRLYSTLFVEIDGLEVNLPEADRAHVMVSGCQELVMRNFLIRGNQVGLSLNSTFGARPITGKAVVDGETVELDSEVILNGRVHLDVPPPASSYEGFKSRTDVVDGTRVLSAPEVDALGTP